MRQNYEKKNRNIMGDLLTMKGGASFCVCALKLKQCLQRGCLLKASLTRILKRLARGERGQLNTPLLRTQEAY